MEFFDLGPCAFYVIARDERAPTCSVVGGKLGSIGVIGGICAIFTVHLSLAQVNVWHNTRQNHPTLQIQQSCPSTTGAAGLIHGEEAQTTHAL